MPPYNFPIIDIKAGKIVDFNKISITTTFSSQLYINPDIKETQQLRTWFENPGTYLQCYSLSAHGASGGHHSIHKHFSDIQIEGIGTGVDPSYILVEETIASMDIDNCWYVAFSLTFEDQKCKTKLTPIEDGIWKCQRCNQRTFECEYRYIFQFNIAYHIGKYDLTAFQDVVEQIIDIHALKFSEYGYEGDTKETTTIFSNLFFNHYLFKLAIHEETFAN